MAYASSLCSSGRIGQELCKNYLLPLININFEKNTHIYFTDGPALFLPE
jgi:hypothetical protein